MTAPYVGQVVNFYANGAAGVGPRNHSTDALAAVVTGVVDVTHVYLSILGYKGDGPYRKSPVIYGTSQSSGTAYCLQKDNGDATDPTNLALAQGSILVGGAGGAAAALSAKGSMKALIGNGTTINSVAFASGSFTGHSGAGACTLTGATVGQRVLALFEIDTSSGDVAAAAGFEATITVNDQIQQSSASNLSTKKYAVILVGASS